VKPQKKYADKLTPAEIRRLFPDQEFSEAAGVLEMPPGTTVGLQRSPEIPAR
jgi:hypothetical protein